MTHREARQLASHAFQTLPLDVQLEQRLVSGYGYRGRIAGDGVSVLSPLGTFAMLRHQHEALARGIVSPVGGEPNAVLGRVLPGRGFSAPLVDGQQFYSLIPTALHLAGQ